MAMVQAYEHSMIPGQEIPPISATGSRKRSSGRRRTPNKLQKSYSTESSLNHMVPSTPTHPDGRQGYE